MNINQKIEVIRMALEKGAHVDINFFNITSEETAKETAETLSNMMDAATEQGSRQGTHWYRTGDFAKGIKVNAFYDNDQYMEEDIFQEELS